MRLATPFSLLLGACGAAAPVDSAPEAPAEPFETRLAAEARAIHPRDGAFAADLPSLGTGARFDLEGVSLGEGLLLRTRAWGRGEDLREVEPSLPHLGACTEAVGLDGACVRRLEYAGDGLDEWWVGLAGGLEQGWTLRERPEGEGLLRLELGVEGGRVEDLGEDELRLVGPDRDWSLGGLVAWDADGQLLPTRLLATADGLRIEVDDRGATWPLEIDPVYTTAAWTLTGSIELHRELAYDVAGAGDLDGDGYADVVVGAHWYDNLRGRAYVFYGSAAGLGESADVVLEGGEAWDHFGYKVGAAGDVNGDGWDDLLVGAYYRGKVYVFHGGPGGVSTSPSQTLHGNADGSFGVSVASAGDINRDGYGDVIVGEHRAVNYIGRAWVYYGSASGLPAAPGTMLEANRTSSLFGWCARSAGDVNRDGYGDVVVGAWGYDNSRGRVYVFHGGPAGLSSSASRSLLGESTMSYFGFSVDHADVNADGYDDVLIGSHYHDSHRGRVYVYYGSPSGIPTVAGTRIDGLATGDDFGFEVAAAGDVDADGYPDVLVGAEYAGGPGRAYLFRGGAAGLSTTATTTLQGETSPGVFGYAVAGAGDVDADGYADVLVGAPWYDNYKGRAYLYRGYADADGDGIPAEVDCDDADAAVGGGWVDGDGDGHGAEPADGCPGEDGVAAVDGDCDDADATVAPGAAERCDGVDQDCDGEIDEDPSDPAAWYADADGDGFGAGSPRLACDGAPGEVGLDGDCDDADPTRSPDAEEQCDPDAVDENCDGLVDGSLDVDSDGLCDEIDPCPLDAAGDSDGDGACDSADLCPAGDDRLDGDGDLAPDACDACPVDFANDSDGDGACDSVDPCPLDALDDADLDGACADADPCPRDPADDADLDGACADSDACPLDPANDADGDGICGNLDACEGFDDLADQDGDGAADGCDRCPRDAANDADADGRCADADPCPTDGEDDADLDGACADADPCPHDAADDADLDGMCADVDPCPVDLANDADGDGLCERDDNCPTVANPGQADADGDGGGDACEPDNDLDGVIDDLDLCPMVPDPDQADTDGDGAGDACDADDDGDGVGDGVDACAGTSSTLLSLADGCAVTQECPCDAGWKNQGAYQACIGGAVDQLVGGGKLSGARGGGAKSAAATTSCGAKKHVCSADEDAAVDAATSVP